MMSAINNKFKVQATVVHPIQECGKILAHHFAHRIGKKSQLSNFLIFKEYLEVN